MNIKVDKLFFIISLFSIHLIPFANFVPFETFPILLVSFCIFIVLLKEKNFIILIKKNILISLFIIFLIFIYLTDIPEGKRNEIELIKYLIGPIIFLSFPRIRKYFGIDELILFGLFIISVFLIFKFQPPLLFQPTCGALEFLIGRLDCLNAYKLASGFSLIAPEPSYLALLLSYYLIVLFFYGNYENISFEKKNNYFCYSVICGIYNLLYIIKSWYFFHILLLQYLFY